MNKTPEEVFQDIREFRIDLAEFKKLLAKHWEEAYDSGFESGFADGWYEGRR